MTSFNWTATGVFLTCFLFVTVLGFLAARWKKGDLTQLHEWGLGGRRFGTVITWFLIGGDFYTAYTVIAVPALVYAVGAYGFFALPYTIIIYPFVYTVMPRLWQICHQNHYITAADFIRDRFHSRALALAVALTGLLATMPYIALQLVGMQVVIKALGVAGTGWIADLPLLIAFVILALYTYTSGLRAPAMIALVKDVMIYLVVIVAVIFIPYALGGYGAVFTAAEHALSAKGGNLILPEGQMLPFASLALGSALAGFMYPHTVTGVLSASGPNVVRRNAILLPAYTILLGLIALLGYMALAAGIKVQDNSSVVPALFQKMFPDWFLGFAYAAVVIGALVPAAIMSIAAANLFTRNIWIEFIRPGTTGQVEAQVAKWMSLVVKFGALAFILFLPTQFAIDLQLLGGVWILQIFPALVFGMYNRFRFLKSGPVLLGWLIGMIAGTWMSISAGLKPVLPFRVNGLQTGIYIGLIALALNLVIAMAGSLVTPSRRGEPEEE
ncbi:MAG: sodium:solute symporter [Verrucomicrobia bacterium]|nr:sodium:solute symporter [Verrucomicrobiota bacterium]